MRNLIRAEIYQYKHDRLFLSMLFASFSAGIFFGLESKYYGYFDDVYIMPLFFIFAVFISMNIGRKYRDGTIRNKIITGKTKLTIFSLRLLINVVINVIMTGLFLFSTALLTYKRLVCRVPFPVIKWLLIGFFLVNVLWSVIFTFVSSIITLKEVAGIVNCILIIAIMCASYQLTSMFKQPEYLEYPHFSKVPMNSEDMISSEKEELNVSCIGYENEESIDTYNKMGLSVTYEKAENPKYIAEPFKSMLKIICHALPSGQINEYICCISQYIYNDITEPYWKIKKYPLYSLFLITVLSAAGMLIFRKKDLK